jgi:serine/threonine-protein kinase HipA
MPATDDGTASLDLALSVAGYFNLPLDEGRRMAAEIGTAVSRWRPVAIQAGLQKAEIHRMASAFDHDDLKRALIPSGGVRPKGKERKGGRA